MGADEYVYLAFFQAFPDVGEFLCRAQAAHVVYGAGEVLQALGESGVVLQRKDGGGHQDCSLLAVHCCLERRTYGYFSLSEPHVAAYQAVHGAGAFHIPLDCLGGELLIRGVFIHERGLEFFLQVGVRREGVGLGGLALGV